MTPEQKKCKEYEIYLQVLIEKYERDHLRKMELYKEALEVFAVDKKLSDGLLFYMNALQKEKIEAMTKLKKFMHERSVLVFGEF